MVDILRQQIRQLRREAIAGGPDDYFGAAAAECQRALALWCELEESRRAEIDELSARLQTIRAEILAAVAERLEAETGGGVGIARELRGLDVNDPQSLQEWLTW